MNKGKCISTIKGQLRASTEESKAFHDKIFTHLKENGATLGLVGHQVFLAAPDPTTFLSVDVWESLEGAKKFFEEPKLAEAFEQLFTQPPEVTFWDKSDWASF